MLNCEIQVNRYGRSLEYFYEVMLCIAKHYLFFMFEESWRFCRPEVQFDFL